MGTIARHAAAGVALAVIFMGATYAAGIEDNNLGLKLVASGANIPAYEPAYEALSPIYKGTRFDKAGGLPAGYPYITLASFDLNGDGKKEIIAAPVEEDDSFRGFCKTFEICPYYILQESGKSHVTIGVIDAMKLVYENDEPKENGYYRLKAYLSAEDKNHYTVYAYSPETKGYVPVKIMGEPKPKEDTEKPAL